MSNSLSSIDEKYQNSTCRFGAYVCTGYSPYATLPKSLEEQVFLESFGNTKKDLIKEYRPYEARSFFLFIYDHKEHATAAMARIVVPEQRRNNGTKTTDDLENIWLTPSAKLTCGGVTLTNQPYWDVATLAVNKLYRGVARAGLVSLGIYNTIMTSAMHCGVDLIVAVLDEAAYRTGNWQYHSPFSPIDGLTSLSYMGSISSIPVYCRFSVVKEKLEEVDPNTAKVLFTNGDIGELIEHVDLAEVERVHKDITKVSPHVIDLEGSNANTKNTVAEH